MSRYHGESGAGSGAAGSASSAADIAELTGHIQRLLEIPGRARVVPGRLPHVAQVGEGAGGGGRHAPVKGSSSKR
jgi:hypothetical protein